MGRIKPALVKRTSKALLEEAIFTTEFSKNKLILRNNLPSKKIRNKTAGYMVRLEKRKIEEQKELHAEQKK